MELKAANQCSDFLDTLKKSFDVYSLRFCLFPVASAASWVASPSPVCSVVTFYNVFRKSWLPLPLPLPFAFASASASASTSAYVSGSVFASASVSASVCVSASTSCFSDFAFQILL